VCNAKQRALLKRARWVLLKNEGGLNERQREQRQGILKSTLRRESISLRLLIL
jgi:hypothetical protein